MNILLLGGIGAGKSAALEILKNRYSANIIEADKVAHFLYERNGTGYRALVRLFGEAVLDKKKNIDRKKLGDILYCDKAKLEQVNSVIHPLVTEEIERRILPDRLNVVEQAPLPNGGIHYDYVWYLYTDIDIRVNRLMLSRGLDRERIAQIMSKQPTENEYRAVADRVLKNNGDIKELERLIAEALR